MKGLDLADPEFGMPACVDMQLHVGANYKGEILLSGMLWGLRGKPYVQRTCFGWVLALVASIKVQYPSDARYKAFHMRARLHEKTNACAVVVKRVHATNNTRLLLV